MCVYIYLYIFISISLSCSPTNRGRANSQARGPDGSSCLQGAGAPQGSLPHCPASSSGFFLAYILQQYHNSLQHPEPWHSRSSGSGADPVPAGAAVLAPPALSQPGAWRGHRGLVGAWELPVPPTVPWLAQGVLPGLGVSPCPAWPGGPSRLGRGTVPSLPCCPLSTVSPRRVVLQLSSFPHPQQAAAGPGSQPSSGTCCPDSGKCHHTQHRQGTGDTAAL